MRKLIVTKKTGFKITDPYKPVIIRDNRGVLFYSTESMLPRVECFNMPGFGTFFIETGYIEALEKPVDYPKVSLPFLVKRFQADPQTFPIIWGINPNKCTIKWKEHEILLDTQFKEKPLPLTFFIIGHEYGHQYFADERLCDRFSINYMLDMGFNKSQIGSSPILALSERQQERKELMVKTLTA